MADEKKQPIWHHLLSVDDLNAWGQVNMMAHLDITYTEVGDDYLMATMPVDHRTKQPLGLLHGGATVALAETLGSTAATLCVDPETHYCVGVEINANHIRAVREGFVTGITRPIHLGRRTQVWQVDIHDAADRLIAVSRITLAVLER